MEVQIMIDRVTGNSAATVSGWKKDGIATQPTEQERPAAVSRTADTSLTIAEAVLEARKKAEEQSDRFKIKRSATQYAYAPTEALARLRQAKTQSEVSSAAAYARRRLAQLKNALRLDSDNAGTIRSAMRQLEKIPLRASRKRQDLSREQLIELRRRKAQEEACRREELRLKQENTRRKSLRSIRETGYLHEASIERGMQAYREAQAAKWELPGSTSATPTAPATPTPADVPPASGCDGIDLQC